MSRKAVGLSLPQDAGGIAGDGERGSPRDRSRQGGRSRRAQRLLYVRYSDNVYGYVRSIVRDDKEAEDLTQQVFMKLITVIVKYEDHGVPFSGWLLRLARNVALDHLRKRRPTPTEDVLDADSHDDEGARDRARDLHTALASLPDEQRSVMVMRHVVGLSPPEIAEQMGRSESSIHGLHHRGRRALQQELVVSARRRRRARALD